MKQEFKVGDKVYYPHFGTNILTLVQHARSSSLLAFEQPNKLISITKDGKMWDAQGTVSGIVHATPENHALLEQLYGVEFEKPPVKPTSKGIVKAMLARGDKNVCCWVSQSDEYPTRSSHLAFIGSVDNDVFIDEYDAIWRFATPFNLHTGTEITELPE